ncbi:MAG: glycosyltransferase [Bacteroidales bacterium]|nr:glycosyltransferase [Bacteroidales bacterium]
MHWLPVILILPYFCLLLRIYRNLLKIKSFKSGSDPKIFVSVVVACRNEEKYLPSLLNDISVQDYHPDLFELIIIDDNSSDRTFNLASEFKGIKNIKVIKNDGKGKKHAIRTGVNSSADDFIILTDADCRMGKAWIKTIASFFDDKKPELIIGQVILLSKTGFLNRFQELEFLSLQGVTAGTAVTGNPVMCNGANLAFTKGTYHKYSDNLHDELVSGDDVFLLHSIKRDPENKIMWLESQKAIVSSVASENLCSFLRQRARWISKAGAYNDRSTQVLAIVTFVTILFQVILLIAGLFNPIFLVIFLAVFLLKSVPDFLILQNSTSRYGKRDLMKWFLPSQLIYPFYVIFVVLWSVFPAKRDDFNSPSPKGI